MADLLERLRSRGCEFDFFQAVWLLERMGDREPVGHRGPVSREAVRFRPHLSVGFPPTDIRRVYNFRPERDGEPTWGMDVAFLGLYGVDTPLPLHYAREVLSREEDTAAVPLSADMPERAASDDSVPATTPTRSYLDLFHHRLISLFYRAWTKYRYDVTFGRPGSDAITDYLLHLIGCPREFARDCGLNPIRLIRYAGLLTQRPRNAIGLEGILIDYWREIPIQVEQFIGRWVALDPADQNRIGRLGAPSRLGVDLTVGEQVYDLCGQINIRLGPVDWATYASFLPDGPRFAQTRSLVRLYCCDPLAFTIELRLMPGEVPETRLGSGEAGSRLGFTSWVRTKPMPETSVTFDATLAPTAAPPSADASRVAA